MAITSPNKKNINQYLNRLIKSDLVMHINIAYYAHNGDLPPQSFIVSAACQATGTSIVKLLSKSRKPEDVAARMLIAVWQKTNHRTSLSRIGTELRRDHATILALLRKYTSLTEVKDKYLLEVTNAFKTIIFEKNQDYSLKMGLYRSKLKK